MPPPQRRDGVDGIVEAERCESRWHRYVLPEMLARVLDQVFKKQDLG